MNLNIKLSTETPEEEDLRTGVRLPPPPPKGECMKNPCEACLVQSCCMVYCDKKFKYNSKVKELYLKNKNKNLFEDAVDDLMKIVKERYPNGFILNKESVIKFILAQE